MRIGVVLSGHLRTFRETRSTFINFMASLKYAGDVDIFCHCWDVEESLTGSWWKKDAANTSEIKMVN